jgi:hypothetical protein
VQDGRLGCGHESCARVRGQGPDGLIPPHKVRGQYVGDCPNVNPIIFEARTTQQDDNSKHGPHSFLCGDRLVRPPHSRRVLGSSVWASRNA